MRTNDRLITSRTGNTDYEDWLLSATSTIICTTCDREWRVVQGLGRIGRCICGNAGYRPKRNLESE